MKQRFCRSIWFRLFDQTLLLLVTQAVVIRKYLVNNYQGKDMNEKKNPCTTKLR